MALNMNKLTEKAQEAMVAAQRLAEERQNTQMEPEHLLYALVAQEGGVVPAVLGKLGVQPAAVLQRLQPALSGLARSTTGGQVYVAPALRQVFDNAQAEADRLKDDYVSTEHFLLALADDQDKSAAGRLLRELGVSRDRLYQALQEV